jgi:hypothetical protein
MATPSAIAFEKIGTAAFRLHIIGVGLLVFVGRGGDDHQPRDFLPVSKTP